MFLPRGKALHENLATSYVAVDALVGDLCEGGFSGIVEIVLRDVDGCVILERGKVAAAIERRHSDDPQGEASAEPYTLTTVNDLAARSRRERGRVSIYGYSTDTATAIAARIRATPLYTRLSTEFADLEKMITKLSRERDRQWFIEMRSSNGVTALLHINDERCRIMMTGHEDEIEVDRHDLIDAPSVRRLLDECGRAGCTFDVYSAAVEDEPADAVYFRRATIEIAQPTAEADGSRAANDANAALEIGHAESVVGRAEAGSEPAEPLLEPRPAVSGSPSGPLAAKPATGLSPASSPDEASLAEIAASVTGDLEVAGEDLIMTEIKRLMGEMARVVEETCRAVERRDSFALCLRAGQLKIADRYAFLDPFGAEFEYLAGEIVFVGRATPKDFIEGLTEALRLAVAAAVESSSQPARLRAFIEEDLRQFLIRNRPELEQYGLDQSIEHVLSQ